MKTNYYNPKKYTFSELVEIFDINKRFISGVFNKQIRPLKEMVERRYAIVSKLKSDKTKEFERYLLSYSIRGLKDKIERLEKKKAFYHRVIDEVEAKKDGKILKIVNSESIEDIISRTSILFLLDYYGINYPQGKNKFFIKLRNERTPSCYITVDKKRCWHDFGTGQGGDLLDFIGVYEGCDVKTAIETLKRLT